VNIFDAGEGAELLLVRPGATEFDEQGRIIGTLDVPLSDLGQQQAKTVCEQSSDLVVKAIYSSPSLAAQQTAKILSERWNRKVKVTEKLRNIDHGLWQGKEIEELRATQPKVARQWEEHPETVCPPEGESVEEVTPRIVKFLRKLEKKHRSGTVVIVVADPLAKVISSLLENRSSGESQNQSEENSLAQADESATGTNAEVPDCGTKECGRAELLTLQLPSPPVQSGVAR
jgi:probable phosphoglycerate mutase